MKPQKEEQKLNQTTEKPAKRRFQIEKLEERIAPAKGGIPGSPPYHYPPGKGGWGGDCHVNPRHGCSV